MRTHYPRTPHLPWSPGATSDDVRVGDLSGLTGRDVVVTEKLDGENTTLYRDGLHARSLDSGHHPSRAWVKALHGRVAQGDPSGVAGLRGEPLRPAFPLVPGPGRAGSTPSPSGTESSAWTGTPGCVSPDVGDSHARASCGGVASTSGRSGACAWTRSGRRDTSSAPWRGSTGRSSPAGWPSGCAPDMSRLTPTGCSLRSTANGRGPEAALWDVRSGAPADVPALLNVLAATDLPRSEEWAEAAGAAVSSAIDSLGRSGDARLAGVLRHRCCTERPGHGWHPAWWNPWACRSRGAPPTWSACTTGCTGHFPTNTAGAGLLRLAVAADLGVLHSVAEAVLTGRTDPEATAAREQVDVVRTAHGGGRTAGAGAAGVAARRSAQGT